MEYVTLGRTGLQVSRVCLGCMSYGQAKTPGILQWPWALSEEEGRPYLKRALEAGINFFDTANVYSAGESEEVLGRAVRDFSYRDEVVLATKVWGPVRQGPNGRGLSRKAILSEVDKSLRRLGTDYIDLYIIHRYDYVTPLEETLEALNDVVRAGKVRYLGASSMHAWQFMKALGIQRANGWAPFVSMQNYYNLMYREDEREMLSLCVSEGIAVTPWSPLARGKLARPWADEPATERAKSYLIPRHRRRARNRQSRPANRSCRTTEDTEVKAHGTQRKTRKYFVAVPLRPLCAVSLCLLWLPPVPMGTASIR